MKSKAELHREWYQKNKERMREYKAANMRKYRSENPAKYAKQSRDAKERLKAKVFEKYGVVCVRCGFSDIRALTLDHILNNGAEERKEIGERGVYLRALQDEHAHEYQILCMNCQFIKRIEAGRENQHNQQWLDLHGRL